MTCETCKFYQSGDDKQGHCRRYPPQVAAPNYFQFPGVKAEFSCGEHQPQPKKPKK